MQANEETEGCLSGNGCGEGKGHKRGRHIGSVTLRQRARHSRGPFAGLLALPASPAPFGRGSYCASVRELCPVHLLALRPSPGRSSGALRGGARGVIIIS